MKLSIIIPAYNEGKTIHLILDKVKEVKLDGGFEKEVVIVNDCSTDNTESSIRKYIDVNPQLPIRYFSHPVNRGKGASIHTGIASATGDYLIMGEPMTKEKRSDGKTGSAPFTAF